jgi:integrase
MERGFEVRGVAPAQEHTVSSVIAAFLAWTETRARIATVHHYRAKLSYIDRLLGPVPLRKLTAQHLEAAYDQLLQHGGKGGRSLNPRTVHHTHRAVHVMLGKKFALKHGFIADNPARLATPPMLGKSTRLIPTVEEAQALLAAATADPWGPLLALALMTGLRREELLALRWEDIDLSECVLTVGQVVEQAGRRFRISPLAKTKSSAGPVEFDQVTAEVLAAWKARQAGQVLGLGLPAEPGALVFADLGSGSVAQPYEPDRATSFVHRIARKAGVRRGVQPIHGARHRHASSLLGLPLKLLSARLRHSSIQVTADLYVHVDRAAARLGAEAAGEALGKLLPKGLTSDQPRPVVRRTKRVSVVRLTANK